MLHVIWEEDKLVCQKHLYLMTTIPYCYILIAADSFKDTFNFVIKLIFAITSHTIVS